MSQPTIRTCHNARAGRCRSKCTLIYFRRTNGRIIPYNADGSGGHSCGLSEAVLESEYTPHSFRPAFGGIVSRGRCPACNQDVSVISVAKDPLLGDFLPETATDILFEKVEWPWSLHICAQNHAKSLPWDGSAHLLKGVCVEKEVSVELTLIVSSVRMMNADNLWNAAIQTVSGRKILGIFDNKLVAGHLTAVCQGEDVMELVTVYGQAPETAQWVEEGDAATLFLPDGWLKS